MQINSEITDQAQIVTVEASRIDAAVAIEFKDKMRDVTASGADRVILDVSTVDFVDSSGLGAIVAAMKQIGPGRKLDLCGLTPNVEAVFRLTRMDTVFNLYASLEEAQAA
jgi:anti-sigma B factor antagonist